MGLDVQAFREVTRNITDGESWLATMRRDIKSMDELMPEKNQEESLGRAIQHTNAILDLYNETGRGLSEDLVVSTLENVVGHATEKPSEMTAEFLEDVELLVWRLRDFDLVPSMQVLESLWEMQKYHGGKNAEKASKQVGRQVNLLVHWREWAELERKESKQQKRGRRRRLQPPPHSYFLDVLRYAAEEQVTMSFTLWELYQSMSADPIVPCERNVYSYVLRILAQSPSNWNVRQRRVLNEMITQSRAKLREPLWPAPEEIRQALQATVPVGRAQDAAWLLRTLERCPEQKLHEFRQECRTLFLKAVLHSDEPGSLLYMEELLQSGNWENDSLEHWKILLQKIAQSAQVGCGARAKAALQRIEDRYLDCGSTWMPDAETLYHIVQAYANEPGRSLSHVLEATEIVKRCATMYDLYPCEAQQSIRLFDTLLATFDDYARTEPKAVKTADDLFRFFVVQHRDGTCKEEPDRFHLGHILRHFNRQFKKQVLQKAAPKSLEYFRLFRTLFHKKIISSPPDLFNVRQLLGTLARSGEPGFGSVANETLTEALAMESPIHPYALGHMYWCVIKCYCNDGKIDQALLVLDQWERSYAANPELIRLTGAPYQTMINALALGENDNDMTLKIIDRLEKQYQNGNHYVILRSKLYKEALQSCESNVNAQEHIHESFRRMNFTTLDAS